MYIIFLGDNLVSMLLKPSYTSVEEEKKVIIIKLIRRKELTRAISIGLVPNILSSVLG